MSDLVTSYVWARPLPGDCLCDVTNPFFELSRM
jgi:hypothetical protein